MGQMRSISEAETRKLPAVSPKFSMLHQKPSTFVSFISTCLLFLSILLWMFSLQHESIQKMNDLGLISTLPPSFIFAIVALCISFCLNLRQARLNVPILMLQLFLLIFMLYGIQNIVEEALRFNVVYRHAGYTEYIMRTGTVDPNLDAYFNWPGFFVLSAVVTTLSGYHSVLSFAGWAPVFYNVIYAGPLYMLFTSASTNKRLIWLGLWFFYLTNWIGQDYFSPQGLNFFFYLVILAILVKWFKASSLTTSSKIQTDLSKQRQWHLGRFTFSLRSLYVLLVTSNEMSTVEELKQRRIMLPIVFVLFLFVIYSHPLTPFALLASVAALVIFRRCRPVWLLIVMACMTGVWDIFMAQTFLVGHMSMITGTFGQITSNISAGLVQRTASGDAEHNFVAAMRVAMTALVWLLAFLGVLRRLGKGNRDIPYVLLSLAPLSLVLANQYGGEMILRAYLFSLPFIAFFAASCFFPIDRKTMHKTSAWMTVGIICTTLVLFGGFLFTRYGNEREDYMTYKEVTGIRYLYSFAPPGSLFIAMKSDPPWQFQDYEQYTCQLFDPGADVKKDASGVMQLIASQHDAHVYLIFTRSEEAASEEDGGLPPGVLNRLRTTLLKSGDFSTIYSNTDAQILVFTNSTERGNVWGRYFK